MPSMVHHCWYLIRTGAIKLLTIDWLLAKTVVVTMTALKSYLIYEVASVKNHARMGSQIVAYVQSTSLYI
uniref:Uncharacterized protein n=1 Tax=Rhipicephalus microplus TaxID=6941 RepID=A0A6M2DCK5_RHIMP